ncbi:AAA family ATPase [uncultured Parvibaculum sp.]|uniref:AAA family ATPase n=2 Tax=Parvibaculum TaxID=256616 RepID=UPI0030D916EA
MIRSVREETPAYLKIWQCYGPSGRPGELLSRVHPLVFRVVRGLPELKWHDKSWDTLSDLLTRRELDDLRRSAIALKLALMVMPIPSPNHILKFNTAMTLVFIAARLGDPLAKLQLIGGLRLINNGWSGGTTARERKEASIAALEWQDRSSDPIWSASSLAEAVQLMNADHSDLLGTRQWESPDGFGVNNNRPTLRILTEIGDADSVQGKELTKRYATLREPLPLAGSRLSPSQLEEALLAEFPWFEDLISQIADTIELRRTAGKPWFRIPPLLVVGPPGCGKSRFARRLGEISGTGHASITVAGSSDNRMLAGTARGWHSTQPCFPVIAMRKANTANPIVVVDEIEKACPSQNGDAQATLLNFLEPETASRYFDECLLTSVNVGEVSWISLANSIEGIKPPLKNRVSLHFVGGPQEEHYPTVIRCLQRDIALELGIDPTVLPTRNKEVEALLHTAFMNGASVRRLRAGLFAWIRSEGINRQLH